MESEGTLSKKEPSPLRRDLQELADSHSTNTLTINNLVRGGVSIEDLDEVLDMRDSLFSTFTSGKGKTLEDVVSAGAVARAYRATSGDLDVLRKLTDRAAYMAGDYEQRLGLHTSMLNYAIDLYEDGDIPED